MEIYPATAGAAIEDRLEVTVGGQKAPLTLRRVWHADASGQRFMEVAAARFAADGPVKVSLTVDGGTLGEPVLRTVGRDLAVKGSGVVLSFELPGSGQYYLRLPKLASSNGTFTVVFWVDDLSRLERTRTALRTAGATEVAARGVRPDSALDQTTVIQALLDKGGALWFPAGVYRAGTLRLRSDTTIYFAPGAVLRASDKEDAVGAEFVAIENARNVKLCGPGTIDANSLQRKRAHNVHNVNLTSSRDVTFEDVLFEESNSWAVHLRKSDRFAARNVKVFSGKDGFDPDSSRDVLIDGAFVAAGDDAIAVKNRFPQDADGKTTERVSFRNSIVTTTKSALKIGTETRGPIRDVTFENCEVFDGERGIVLYARDGGPIERCAWRNIRLFMINWPQEKESGTVFHVTIDRRQAATPVRDCVIENIVANWIARSEFAGLPDAPLDGIRMRNITVKADAPKSGRPYLFDCRGDVRVPVEGLTIDWQGNQAKWAGVASGKGLIITEAGPRTEGRGAPASDAKHR